MKLLASGAIINRKFGLKVAFQGDDFVEHIWVANLVDLGNGKFSALLANEPDQLGKLHLKDKVVFFQHRISDWNFVVQGRGYGFYTLRAMLGQMAPEQARRLREFLSETPMPVNW